MSRDRPTFMHSRQSLLRARLATIRRDLNEAIGRIGQDDLSWAPTLGMRTVSGQLVEIIITEMQLISQLRDDRRIGDPTAIAMLGDTMDIENLKTWSIRVRGETLEYLDSLSEEQLAEEISFGVGWFGSMGLSTIPRAEVFLNIADHEWYHVGQLTSYLWALGINPYR